MIDDDDRHETRSTGSVGKLHFIPLLGTVDLGMGMYFTP